MQFDAAKCAGCGACVQTCAKGAIFVHGPKAGIDRKKCDGCGTCAKSCKSGALEQIGRWYSVEELHQELVKDLLFFRNSGGGITLSGGEPLSQIAFLSKLIPSLKEEGIHIALDTCGFFSGTEHLRSILKQTDLILFDIKAMDQALHKQLTGIDNAKILSDFDMICGQKIPVRVRIPLIAGLNDSEDELTKIAGLVSKKPAVELVEFLPYHAYGTSKYEMLGLEYGGSEYAPPSVKRLQELAGLFKTRNIPVRIMEH
jgi:pyruvate formate lyase activating enzyme